MRRLLIGLTVAVLIVVSVGVGITVARWPRDHGWPGASATGTRRV